MYGIEPIPLSGATLNGSDTGLIPMFFSYSSLMSLAPARSSSEPGRRGPISVSTFLIKSIILSEAALKSKSAIISSNVIKR